MPVINRIADYAEEMKTWRRWLHRNPELKFDCHKTAAFVVERLREFGVDEIHEGIATSGVVAVINGQGDGPTIGLRADMDALPIFEESGVDYSSETEGNMHACGHDGHTTMLLGAAKYLAETRRFKGRAVLIFQPAEEDGGGAGVMVEEGVMERFGLARVFALHNAPNIPVGHFHSTPGPIMAAVDEFEITFKGRGGHAAMPEDTVDPIPAVAALAQALPTVVSRNVSAIDDIVLSVTSIHAGKALNVVPETAFIGGTVRCFSPEVRDVAESRIRALAEGQAAAFGVEAQIIYRRDYPPTINDADQAEFALSVARAVAGEAAVVGDAPKQMGSEDFAYMLERTPGAYLFLGQGDGPVCHHPAYDFNDEISPIGASFFAQIVERAQPL
ncbi:M20 aminoacylase family protein [Pseudoruegeria sp. SHC-113]|uniref:M20 aminoacylase family protein n=1 Tax=Pseudoruegeria sp. SHC-113 TaxID=2855439 RepID=UPI0021BA483C|nr:M20 aminoacylase family protein [Pseudoruegeria sp. SHC-113]MCT8160861.1 amidohydrolase [Pseudoruegeria sp. SHC-113]